MGFVRERSPCQHKNIGDSKIMTNKRKKKASQVIDATQPGYEAEIATDPDQLLKDLPSEENVISAGIAAIPDTNLNGALLIQETEVLIVNGVRVKYRKVPAMLFNTARSAIRTKLENSEPEPQEFIADSDGTRVSGDQSPIYHEALAIWENETKNLDALVSTAVSLFSGVVLVDGMPPDESWLPRLQEMFELVGLELDLSFKSFMYEPDRIKELYFKEYIVLGNAQDMNNFTTFQNSGETAILAVSGEAASAMFRPTAQ
jgi:hypothetical protein